MIRLLYFFLFGVIAALNCQGHSQDTNSVTLHIQVLDEGVCLPPYPSVYYSTSKFQKTKSVFQYGSYYSTVYAYINSEDSSNLNIQTNHLHQSGSLNFNPTLAYELVLIRSDGFNRTTPDSMVIKVSKLDKNAQLTIPFKKGVYDLRRMKLFKELNTNTPNFRSQENISIQPKLKLDSIAKYSNGSIKAKYYIRTKNFPLYFVKEFDSINPDKFAQGYKMLNNYNNPQPFGSLGQSIWSTADATKYGYWEYFNNGKRVKHELWASMLMQQYEWYPTGQIKFATEYGQTNKQSKHTKYLENGSILEEFQSQSNTQRSYLKHYVYSSEGDLILINTYDSKNGLTKQGLQKRELFYPSGQLKMEENLGNYYNIKNYNEDGTQR